MFDSGITAQDFLAALKTEADIAPNIPDMYFIDWLNEVEQTLYDNIIREEAIMSGEYTVPGGTGNYKGTVDLSELSPQPTGAAIRYEDIVSVRLVNRQLTPLKTSAGESGIFTFSRWKGASGALTILVPKAKNPVIYDVYVIYTIRPTPKTDMLIRTENIKVPPEFLDMVRARLRGEAYKFANEDALAAKWFNDYNAQLEYFRAWIASKSPTFGV